MAASITTGLRYVKTASLEHFIGAALAAALAVGILAAPSTSQAQQSPGQ